MCSIMSPVFHKSELFVWTDQDDLWRPQNHLTQADCDKYVKEVAASGFDIKPFVIGK